MNCLTEMYSALCAEVPIKTDPATCLDKKLIARLDEADRVIVCGQSHAICASRLGFIYLSYTVGQERQQAHSHTHVHT